jgi:hypothetical protein
LLGIAETLFDRGSQTGLKLFAESSLQDGKKALRPGLRGDQLIDKGAIITGE